MFSRFGVAPTFDWFDVLALLAMAYIVIAGAWLILRLRTRGGLRHAPPPFPFDRVRPDQLAAKLPSLGPVAAAHVERKAVANLIPSNPERVAFVGPSCSGKTHEAVRLARELASDASDDVAIYVPSGPLLPPPGAAPQRFPSRPILVLDDPLDDPAALESPDASAGLALALDAGCASAAERIGQTIEWFEAQKPERLTVIVTANAERWEAARSGAGPLKDFGVVTLPALTSDESAEYVKALCKAFGFDAPDEETVVTLARANDGTFRPLYDSLCDLRARDPEATKVDREQAERFRNSRDTLWQGIVSERFTNVERDVLGALSALRACHVPLYEQFLANVSVQIGRRRTRTAAREAALEDALKGLARRWLTGDPSGRILVHECRLSRAFEDRDEVLMGVARALAETSRKQIDPAALAFALARVALQLPADAAAEERTAVGDALLSLSRRDWRGELWAAQGSLILAATEDDATYVTDAAAHLRAAAELLPEAAPKSLRARLLLAAAETAVKSQAAGRAERLERAARFADKAMGMLAKGDPLREQAQRILDEARSGAAKRSTAQPREDDEEDDTDQEGEDDEVDEEEEDEAPEA